MSGIRPTANQPAKTLASTLFGGDDIAGGC
jgi:hypothetical protein